MYDRYTLLGYGCDPLFFTVMTTLCTISYILLAYGCDPLLLRVI